MWANSVFGCRQKWIDPSTLGLGTHWDLAKRFLLAWVLAFVAFVGNSNRTVKNGQLRNKHFCTNHHQIGFHLGRGPPKTSCKLQGVVHQGTFPPESALNLCLCDITGYLPLEALSIFKHFNSKVLTIAGDYRFCRTFWKITSGILPLVIWKICCIIFHVCGGVRVLRVSWPSACEDLHIFYAE